MHHSADCLIAGLSGVAVDAAASSLCLQFAAATAAAPVEGAAQLAAGLKPCFAADVLELGSSAPSHPSCETARQHHVGYCPAENQRRAGRHHWASCRS